MGKGQRRGRCVTERGSGRWDGFEDGIVWALEWGFSKKPGQTSLSEHLYSLSIIIDSSARILGNVKIVHVSKNDLRKFVMMQAFMDLRAIFLSIWSVLRKVCVYTMSRGLRKHCESKNNICIYNSQHSPFSPFLLQKHSKIAFWWFGKLYLFLNESHLLRLIIPGFICFEIAFSNCYQR